MNPLIKHIIPAAIALLLLSSSVSGQRVTVTRVLDSNLLLLSNNRVAKMAGIDVPSKNNPDSCLNRLSQEIISFLKDNVLNSISEVIFVPDSLDYSVYSLVYLNSLKNGGKVNLNRYFLENGYGRFFNNAGANYKEEYSFLEQSAIENKKGVWALNYSGVKNTPDPSLRIKRDTLDIYLRTLQDIYLRNGFIIRNGYIIDTSGKMVRILRSRILTETYRDMITKISTHKFDPRAKSEYLPYSKELLEHWDAQIRIGENVREQKNSESVKKINHRLDSQFTWRNSLFLAIGYGIPQGYRVELGYNFEEYLSLGFTYGREDTWSNHSNHYLGAAGSVHYPMSVVTPYLLFSGGTSLRIFGEPDYYMLIMAGILIPAATGVHLKLESGIDLTSKHISGGEGLFGNSGPEIREEAERFCFHLSVEFDFAAMYRGTK